MNYMKDVAQMLGVELDEEFLISNTDLICKFVDNGLLQKHIPIMTWHYDNNMLRCLLSGEYEIVKKPKPILDDAEKEYLSNVIKPFRDRVRYIVKGIDIDKEYESIRMNIIDINKLECNLDFPLFKKDTMYKGMVVGKQYSLEDLEL